MQRACISVFTRLLRLAIRTEITLSKWYLLSYKWNGYAKAHFATNNRTSDTLRLNISAFGHLMLMCTEQMHVDFQSNK